MKDEEYGVPQFDEESPPKLKKCHRVIAAKLRMDFKEHCYLRPLGKPFESGFRTAVRAMGDALEEVNRHHKHPFDREVFEEVIYGGGES